MVTEFKECDFHYILTVLRLSASSMRTESGKLHLYQVELTGRKWVFTLPAGTGVATVFEPLPINPQLHRKPRPYNPIVKVVRVESYGKMADIVLDLRRSLPNRKRNKPNRATRLARRAAG